MAARPAAHAKMMRLPFKLAAKKKQPLKLTLECGAPALRSERSRWWPGTASRCKGAGARLLQLICKESPHIQRLRQQ